MALRWGVRALVVKPCHVPLAVALLAGTAVKVVGVVGFPHGGPTVRVKALETGYLTDREKRAGARLAARAGAAYVKTGTGFAPGGATVTDVRLLRRTVTPRVGIKAAGGIRSYAEALALVRAGADLIGTSRTEAILAEATREAA